MYFKKRTMYKVVIILIGEKLRQLFSGYLSVKATQCTSNFLIN